MKVLIASKSAAESYLGGSDKALTFVINIQVNSETAAIVPVPVDKKDFDKYEVGKYYDIA